MKIKHLLGLMALALLLWSCGIEGLNSSDSSKYSTDQSYPGNYADNTTGEGYNEIIENPFIEVSEEPTSTFSIDADGASYSNVRRFLNDGSLPPPDAVRTEELINYFDYDYPNVLAGHPIALNGEVSTCPWQEGHKLIRIGIKGKDIPQAELPPSNLVFLIDVSGSMTSPGSVGISNGCTGHSGIRTWN